MNNTCNDGRPVNNCHGCKWLDRYKEDGSAWSNGANKEKLIGVGFGSIWKNSCSDEKKNRPLKSERRIWSAVNFTKKVLAQDRCILKT